jgi:hypothetical protein
MRAGEKFDMNSFSWSMLVLGDDGDDGDDDDDGDDEDILFLFLCYCAIETASTSASAEFIPSVFVLFVSRTIPISDWACSNVVVVVVVIVVVVVVVAHSSFIIVSLHFNVLRID